MDIEDVTSEDDWSEEIGQGQIYWNGLVLAQRCIVVQTDIGQDLEAWVNLIQNRAGQTLWERFTSSAALGSLLAGEWMDQTFPRPK